MISFWPWHHMSVPSLKAITYRVSLRRDRNRMLWWLKKRGVKDVDFFSQMWSAESLTMKISPGFVSNDYLLSHRPLIENMVQCWVPPQLSYKLFFHPTYVLQNHPSWRYTDDLGCLSLRKKSKDSWSELFAYPTWNIHLRMVVSMGWFHIFTTRNEV